MLILNIIDSNTPTPQELAEARGWDVVCRLFSDPRSLQVYLPTETPEGNCERLPVNGIEVFEYLQLPLDQLMGIFGEQTPRPGATSPYDGLGKLTCSDMNGWSKLAQLLDKDLDITLKTSTGGPEVYEWKDYAKVSRKGDVDRSLEWIEGLQPGIAAVREYYRRTHGEELDRASEDAYGFAHAMRMALNEAGDEPRLQETAAHVAYAIYRVEHRNLIDSIEHQEQRELTKRDKKALRRGPRNSALTFVKGHFRLTLFKTWRMGRLLKSLHA